MVAWRSACAQLFKEETHTEGMMSDEELAAQIKNCLADLNGLLAEAVKRKIDVTVYLRNPAFDKIKVLKIEEVDYFTVSIVRREEL